MSLSDGAPSLLQLPPQMSSGEVGRAAGAGISRNARWDCAASWRIPGPPSSSTRVQLCKSDVTKLEIQREKMQWNNALFAMCTSTGTLQCVCFHISCSVLRQSHTNIQQRVKLGVQVLGQAIYLGGWGVKGTWLKYPMGMQWFCQGWDSNWHPFHCSQRDLTWWISYFPLQLAEEL